MGKESWCQGLHKLLCEDNYQVKKITTKWEKNLGAVISSKHENFTQQTIIIFYTEYCHYIRSQKLYY
jgi:hypothetical protein